MATAQGSVPTVAGDGNTPISPWSTFVGTSASLTDPGHTAVGSNGFSAHGGVPTVFGDGITPPELWAGAIKPYSTYMRWFAFGWHYIFNTASTGFVSGYPDNPPTDMFSVRGWVFDQPRSATQIPQAPDSSTRFPAAP